MIGRIQGQLAEKNPPEILVDCNGVGYELLVPMSTFYNLPVLGEKVSLHTQFVVREDAQILYGFTTSTERAAFRLLIKISGVGPRTALSVLSGMSVEELAQAVTLQEPGRIIKVPGIGKKTAERLLLELKGKLGRVGMLGPERAIIIENGYPLSGRHKVRSTLGRNLFDEIEYGSLWACVTPRRKKCVLCLSRNDNSRRGDDCQRHNPATGMPEQRSSLPSRSLDGRSIHQFCRYRLMRAGRFGLQFFPARQS